MTEPPTIPTDRLTVVDPNAWADEARAFAESVAERQGTRQPIFEVFWPAPAHLDSAAAAAWLAKQQDHFDAVRFDLDAPVGVWPIVTLPPYSELEAAAHGS